MGAGGLRRATPRQTSGGAAKRSNPTSKERRLGGCRRPETSYPTSDVRGGGRDKLPHVRRWGGGRDELPHVRHWAVAKRSNPTSKERWLRGRRRPEASYPTSDVGAAAETSYPTFKERWLRGSMRAERSYSTFKVRRGDFVQDKEQRLCFAGAAVKR